MGGKSRTVTKTVLKNEKFAEKGRFNGNCAISRTIFKPRALF